MGGKVYRCRAVSLAGFIQQLAVAYVAHGYWFYARGWIPIDKDPEAIDRKLIDRYGIDVSKWERARRKRAGLANLHYLRFGRTFVLIATHGQHWFFEAEAKAIRDIRRVPFKLGGQPLVLPHDVTGRLDQAAELLGSGWASWFGFCTRLRHFLVSHLNDSWIGETQALQE